MRCTRVRWLILALMTAWLTACSPVAGPISQEPSSEQPSTPGPDGKVAEEGSQDTASQERSQTEPSPQETSQESPSQDAGPDVTATDNSTQDDSQEPVQPDADEPTYRESSADAGEPLPDAQPEIAAETAAETTPEPTTDTSQPDQPARPLNRPALVGVGNFGLRLVTYDNKTWKKFGGTGSGNPHTPDLLRAVAYGDGVFVAVGGNQNMGIQRSADGGRSWQDVGASTGGWIGGVAYHKGHWFYATGGGPKIYRSVDRGQTWKPIDLSRSKLPKLGAIRGMSSHNGVLAAHGDQGTLIVSNDDGATWINRSIPNTPDRIEHLKWIGGVWFAAGTAPYNGGYTTACRTSKDLKSWKTCPIKYTRSSVLRLAKGQLYHLVGKSYQTTKDGNSWTSGTTTMTNVFWTGKEWWGLNFDGTYVGPSLDKLKRVTTTRYGARDWTTGFTY